MSGYTKIIVETLGCTEARADAVEDIMRNEIFHSTLDWQSREELEQAARDAALILAEQDAENS